MSLTAAASLMSNILYGRRFAPYWVQLIIGGLDEDGGHVYSLDAAGGSIPDDYVTTGSGSPYVYGVLEDHYKEGLKVDDGVDIAIRGLTAAMSRDSASGNGYDIAKITKKGWISIPQSTVEARRKVLKI